MVQQPSQSTVPTFGSSKPRFCPYCGEQVAEGASFCAECGRQLPLKKPAVAAPPQTIQPSQQINVSVPQPAKPQNSLREVPLTVSQQAAIRNVYSAPAGITRIFGAMFGVSAIVVAIFDAQTTTLDPTTFAVFVLSLGIVAIALSGASRNMRRTTNRLLSRGKAMELNGIAKMNSSPSPETARVKSFRSKVFDLGGIQFVMPAKCAGLIRYDSPNTVTYAPGDFLTNNLQNVMVLSVNQASFGKAVRGFLAAPGYGGSNGWSMAKKRRV